MYLIGSSEDKSYEYSGKFGKEIISINDILMSMDYFILLFQIGLYIH